MSKLYTDEHEFIICEYGRIISASYVNGINFHRTNENKEEIFVIVKRVMSFLAVFCQKDFVDLYLSLTDDVEAKEIAQQLFDRKVNKDLFPLDLIKELQEEKIVIPSNAYSVLFFNYSIKVANGLVIKINEGSSYAGRIVSRKDCDFICTLTRILDYYARNDPNEFRLFYNSIKKDKIPFFIAEKIRKQNENIFNVN